MTDSSILQAADFVRRAEGLLLTAGAGMGVDSGLPDFRGNEGFWKAYPPFKQRGLSFVDMANPEWFEIDPGLAWGFYGHRSQLYHRTEPHAGFDILRRWCAAKGDKYFIFTSNVDGHFQKAGFSGDQILECHGSLRHLQCTRRCGEPLWEMEVTECEIDESSFRAKDPLPSCPKCGGLARPNVLMFGDFLWDSTRTDAQHHRFSDWHNQVSNLKLVVIEMGAGTGVPTVRHFSESLEMPLLRINPREPQGPSGTIQIPLGAMEALRLIDQRL